MMIFSLGLMAIGCDTGEKEQEVMEVVDNTLINGTWIDANSGFGKYVFNAPNYEFHQKISSVTFNATDYGTYEATNKGKLTLSQTSRTYNGVSEADVRTLNLTFIKINENKISIKRGVVTNEFTRE